MNLKAIQWARDLKTPTASEHHLIHILACRVKSSEPQLTISLKRLTELTCGLSHHTVRSNLYKLKQSGLVDFGRLAESGGFNITIKYG